MNPCQRLNGSSRRVSGPRRRGCARLLHGRPRVGAGVGHPPRPEAHGEVLVAVQVVAGLALLTYGARPPESTHYLYGITGTLVLPFAWSYMKDRDQRQALLIYALICLFIFGLAIRGMTTGRVG